MAAPILLALLLAQTPEAGSNEYRQAYEQAFREAYRRKGIEACVTSATGAASAGIDATPICVCATDKLLFTKTVEELSKPPVKTEVEAAVLECVKAYLLPKGAPATTP